MQNRIDIVFVTYNSQDWVKDCFESLCHSNYEFKKISIAFVDNCSQDQTIKILNEMQKKYNYLFNKIDIILQTKNLGFGIGNNIGAQLGNSPYICFFNIDTELYENTLADLNTIINESGSNTAVWELHQTPYEHPKPYNRVSGKTAWCSGAAMIVRRSVFEKVKGFDPQLFMYAEDVDLCWRIKNLGYELKYCPQILIHHYAYNKMGEVKPLEYKYGFANNLLLRYRYGNRKDQIIGHLLILKAILFNKLYPKCRSDLLICYLRNLYKINYFKRTHIHSLHFQPVFNGLNYSAITLNDERSI